MDLAGTVPGPHGLGNTETSSARLMERLRQATAQAHEGLDRALDLFPLETARIAALLGGFLSFHRAWEPALTAHPHLAALFEGRSRIALLEADLAALGVDEQARAALEPCPQAARLAADPRQALGSLYVMEGSTLGGQVISRALARAGGFPPAGLAYFNPYGAEVGVRWRAFGAAAQAMTPAWAYGRVEVGALACFALLTDWLPPRLAPRACS